MAGLPRTHLVTVAGGCGLGGSRGLRTLVGHNKDGPQRAGGPGHRLSAGGGNWGWGCGTHLRALLLPQGPLPRLSPAPSRSDSGVPWPAALEVGGTNCPQCEHGSCLRSGAVL